MRVERIPELKAVKSYGVDCRMFLPSDLASRAPVGTTFCSVEPGQSSVGHSHHENEIFFIHSGAGQIEINGESKQVTEGDLIVIPPFARHAIRNTTHHTLHFVAFYWADNSALDREESPNPLPTRSLIFTAPPTPNGDLHLGHLSGPFLGADIYRRFLRLNGREAVHSSGRDDNQSYVVTKAIKDAAPPLATADKYAAQIQSTLRQAQVELSNFHAPNSSQEHTTLTQQAFTRLFNQGYIYEKEVPTLFCKDTGAYLFEAHVSGLCPHCHQPSDGNGCEQCGEPNDCVNLIDPKSRYGSGTVEVRPCRRLFFKMSAFSDALARYHESAVIPEHLAALCRRMLLKGLPDIAAAHISDWGIPVPVDGFEGHRIYVWFEMAFGYLLSAKEASESGSVDPGRFPFYQEADAEVVHFFGFDNGYFHTLLLPAIMMAYDPEIKLPRAYVVNELLSLDGSKFSTSRGHLIWARDLLSEFGVDAVRYYLSLIRPETWKRDFRLSDFGREVQTELADRWESLLSSVFSHIDRVSKGVIPEPGAWTPGQRQYFTRLLRIIDEVERSYGAEDFSPARVCRCGKELVEEATRFLADQLHIDGEGSSKDMRRTTTALLALSAKVLGTMMTPIVPDFGKRVWEALGLQNRKMSWSEIRDFLPAGTKTCRPQQPFFPVRGTEDRGTESQLKVA